MTLTETLKTYFNGIIKELEADLPQCTIGKTSKDSSIYYNPMAEIGEQWECKACHAKNEIK